jgi:hypothetical protein
MLTVGASLTAGNLRYDTHGASVVVRRGMLPIVDRMEYRLPRGVRLEAEPGDDLQLDLDGGEGAETVFTGTVTGVGHDLLGARIVGHNGGASLAAFRPSDSFEDLSVGDVVRQLCADVGVAAQVADGPTLARCVLNARSTALDEVTRLLHLAAQTASFDGSGRLIGFEDEPGEERALRYGREVVAADVSGPAPDAATRVVTGEGAGDPGASNALWPVSDFWAGGAPAPGVDTRLRTAHEIRTTDDADTAGAAWSARHAAAQTPIRLRCWLLPAIAPNDLLHVQEAPEDLGALDVRVRQVVHRIDPSNGATTDVWGFDDGAGQDMLGSLLGAIGGLL